MQQVVDTACRDCVFNLQQGNVQVGCSFNDRLSKFPDIELTEEGDQKYYIIRDRLCNACHTTEWAAEQDTDDIYQLVWDRIKITYDAVIYVYKNHSYDDILNSFKQLESQTLTPKNVFIILNRVKIPAPKLAQQLMESAVNWKIEQPQINMNRLTCIDRAIQNSKSQFYGVFCPTQQIPCTTFENLNNLVNIELQQPLMILPFGEHGHGLIINRSAYNYVQGSTFGNAARRIRKLANEQNLSNLIFSSEILCA
jgi:hypothetical protein